MSRFASELTDLAEHIAETATARGSTVAVAEAMTSGRIAACLSVGAESGAETEADGWFAGGVVAVGRGMRARLLGVTESGGSAAVAEQMVLGILELSGADVALGVTDAVVGGDTTTVFIAVGSRERVHVFEHHLEGDDGEIVGLAVLRGLQHLKGALFELS